MQSAIESVKCPGCGVAFTKLASKKKTYCSKQCWMDDKPKFKMIASEVMELRTAHPELSWREIAGKLGIHPMTAYTALEWIGQHYSIDVSQFFTKRKTVFGSGMRWEHRIVHGLAVYTGKRKSTHGL